MSCGEFLCCFWVYNFYKVEKDTLKLTLFCMVFPYTLSFDVIWEHLPGILFCFCVSGYGCGLFGMQYGFLNHDEFCVFSSFVSNFCDYLLFEL